MEKLKGFFNKIGGLFKKAWNFIKAKKVLFIIIAAVLIVAGILRKQKVLKISGIWIALAAVAKVIFFDMASMAPVYKTAAFLCLGIILLIISYYYTKHKNSDIIKK